MHAPRWHYLLLSTACLIAAAGLVMLLVSGCRSSARTMDCAAMHGCTAGPVEPLDQATQQAAIDAARAEVEGIIGRTITTPDPIVRYVRCPFQVKRSNFGNVCAAGVTRVKGGHIQVMTVDPKRTAPLVQWEAKNWFLCQNGRCDLAI